MDDLFNKGSLVQNEHRSATVQHTVLATSLYIQAHLFPPTILFTPI